MSKLVKFFSQKFTPSLRNEASDCLDTKDMFSSSARKRDDNSGAFDKKPLKIKHNFTQNTEFAILFHPSARTFGGRDFKSEQQRRKMERRRHYVPHTCLKWIEEDENKMNSEFLLVRGTCTFPSEPHLFIARTISLLSPSLPSFLFWLSAGRIMKWGSEGSGRWRERAQSFILMLSFGQNMDSVYYLENMHIVYIL